MYRSLTLAFAMIVAVTAPASADEVWQTLPKFPPMPKADESGMAPVNDIQMYSRFMARRTRASPW